MVHKTILTLILALWTNLLFGQLVLVYHLNDSLDINNKRVTEIKEELKIGNGTIKYFKKFNDKNQIISDERHDKNDKFIARFAYTYDSLTGLRKSETKELSDKSGNHNFTTEKYEYTQKGQLRKIIYLAINETIYQTALVTNNEKGHPIKVETFTENGVSTGSETAVYNYKENKATFDQMDSNGTVIYSSFFTLDFKKEKSMSKSGFEYDDKGNLVKTPDGFNEIVYDQYGNWTSIKMYRKIKGVDKLTQENTRLISYTQ